MRIVARPAGRRPERWLRALVAESAWSLAESEVAASAAGFSRRGRASGPRTRRDAGLELVGKDSLKLMASSSRRRMACGRLLAGGATRACPSMFACLSWWRFPRTGSSSLHLNTVDAGAGFVSRLLGKLLMNRPAQAAKQVARESRLRRNLGFVHWSRCAIDPTARRHPPENPQAPHAIASQPSQPDPGRNTRTPLAEQASIISRSPLRYRRSSTGASCECDARNTKPVARVASMALARRVRCGLRADTSRSTDTPSQQSALGGCSRETAVAASRTAYNSAVPRDAAISGEGVM